MADAGTGSRNERGFLIKSKHRKAPLALLEIRQMTRMTVIGPSGNTATRQCGPYVARSASTLACKSGAGVSRALRIAGSSRLEWRDMRLFLNQCLFLHLPLIRYLELRLADRR
jgi:hypothetical protein